MAKTVIEISDERLGDLEPYKDKLGELLLLGLSQIKIHESLLLYQLSTRPGFIRTGG
jgi:hypothetical protein